MTSCKPLRSLSYYILKFTLIFHSANLKEDFSKIIHIYHSIYIYMYVYIYKLFFSEILNNTLLSNQIIKMGEMSKSSRDMWVGMINITILWYFDYFIILKTKLSIYICYYCNSSNISIMLGLPGLSEHKLVSYFLTSPKEKNQVLIGS